ncbi:MAG: 23S rRNA (guanosine(2251)-2'-O)-methyltransferase RlmB [Acidobacteria bacterium]|nr:23S rRNA (guanosine(2251)-2'-O)-methyltransferase RlmB [Acidobacteriota bacterium]
MAVLYGIHSVEQALAAGRPLERLLVARPSERGRVERLLAAARAASVPVRFVRRQELDRLAGTREHQGVAALVGAKQYADLEELVGGLKKPALLVLLDGVEDPRNLGAILRTAYCAGADGIVLPERRAAGITPAAEKASAGASEHLTVARVTNLNRALERLKEAGLWLVGLDERAEKSFTEVDYTDSVGVVLGGEGKGLHEQVRAKCDFLVSIPTFGSIRSLNVAVAAGVVLYEAVRQRQSREAKPR